MGVGQSKDELLYQEVLNGNHDKVKALRQNGASLEWIDKEGRTPLILACTRGELLEMAITLLNLGANLTAYRPGTHGGFPLHHAAKMGLEKTVSLLLSRGADPLAINDDGLTPLDMARSRGHVLVVRLLEERISLFSGMVREISGLGIIEMFAPNLCTKKIWVVVLPTELHPVRAQRYELVISLSPKVAQARNIIQLWKAEVEEPKFSLSDPVLYITDKTTKARYKFLSKNEGDKAQLERLYKACKGISENPASSNVPSVSNPSTADNGWGNGSEATFNGWGPPDLKEASKTANYGGWEGNELRETYNGWSLPEAGPSSSQSSEQLSEAALHVPSVGRELLRDPEFLHTPVNGAPPSAPPLPSEPIYYPEVDSSITAMEYSSTALDETAEKVYGTCVICWDGPAEAACVPCGHLAGCMPCLSEVQRKNWGCPVCRGPIQQIVKVYVV